MKRFITTLNLITSLAMIFIPMGSHAIANYDLLPAINDTSWHDPRDYSKCNAAPTAAASPITLPADMTLDQQIGQTFIVGFDAGTPKATIVALFTKYRLGGIYLTGTSNAAAAGFDAAFYAQLSKAAGIPITASSDEEGAVTRYSYPAGSFPAAASMGANAQKIGAAAGAVMKQNGLNTDLAPVLDLRDVGTGLTGRSFSSNPTTVATQAGAFTDGLVASGITPIFKHFPGFDRTTSGSTDDIKVVMSGSVAGTTAPYKTLVTKFPNAGVMMSNMYVNAIDSANPTSLSAKSVTYLRGTIGFHGMITTDDLAVRSVTAATGSLAASVTKALAAGITMPLFSNPSDAGLQAIINQVKAGVAPTVITSADNLVLSFKKGKAATSTAPSSCCPKGTGSSGPLVGGDNATKIFNFLVSKGLKDFQAAGFMANIQAESGFDPAVNEGGGHANKTPVDGQGFGIAQWTWTARQAPLVALAGKQGLPVNTLAPQLDFLWSEVTGGYKSSVYAPLKAATTYEQAVEIVMIHFEVPGDQSQSAIQGRINGGRPLLKKFGGSGGTGAGGGGTSSSGSCGAVGGASAAKIVQIALAEVGTNEGGTPNGGPACKYQGTACPQDWCADFVSWVFNQAGVPFKGGADGGWRIAGASGVGDWFKANGTWIANPGLPIPITDPKAPKPGDVVIYGGTGHANIVVSYDGTTIKTVGGNESDAVSAYTSNVFGTPLGWGRLK